jgi:hypothetical protein
LTAAIIDIADAVTAELNAAKVGTFAMAFIAARMNLPEFDLSAMDTLHVTVVPKGVKESYASRNSAQAEYSVDVGVMKRFINQADQDAMLGLVEQIRTFFRMRRLAQYQPAMCVGAENDPVYDPTHLREKRQFTSVLTLTFRVVA